MRASYLLEWGVSQTPPTLRASLTANPRTTSEPHRRIHAATWALRCPQGQHCRRCLDGTGATGASNSKFGRVQSNRLRSQRGI